MVAEPTEKQPASSARNDHAIEINNLTKTFGGGQIVAVDDFDLQIGADEFVVLLGPSGCGKTTTLRCIAGLEMPDFGTIFIDGEERTNSKPKDRNLAYVFQNIALFPHMSVRENIRFGLDMQTSLGRAEKEDRIREAAELLGIDEYLDRDPGDLSGGQQQRVALGRAMVMEPSAFLLDEPFSALDAKLRHQMQTEVKKLHQKLDRTMVFVTHDQEEAMALGDKIVVMDNGQIQQVGTPHEVYREPNTLFVAQFIGSPQINLFDCDLVEDGGTLELAHEAFSVPLAARDADELSAMAGEAVTAGIRPENFAIDDEGFAVDVSLVEPIGSQDAVYLNYEGKEIRILTEEGKITERDAVSISFSPEDVMLFDSDGNSIEF